MLIFRSQYDAKQDEISLSSGLACTQQEDKARQEFKAESDVNVLLRKYGAVPQRPVAYGEVDFDLDFQTAQLAVRDATEGFNRLPKAVRDKYPDLPSLFAAIAQGEDIELNPAPANDEVSSSGAGAAPSDSAAGGTL